VGPLGDEYDIPPMPGQVKEACKKAAKKPAAKNAAKKAAKKPSLAEWMSEAALRKEAAL